MNRAMVEWFLLAGAAMAVIAYAFFGIRLVAGVEAAAFAAYVAVAMASKDDNVIGRAVKALRR